MLSINFDRGLHNIMNWNTLKYFLQVIVSPSEVTPREARRDRPGSVRHCSRRPPRGNAVMSRRKVSVKDLGQGECYGWLYKKKDSRGFLGTRWKKYWFVLKRSALYWYTSQMADKAEGYIYTRDFTLEQATEYKKKYAMKASHPQIMSLYFAAESVKEMNKWLSAFKEASIQRIPTTACEDEGCYSEESDHEETESVEVACQLYTEQLTAGSINEELPPPRCSSSPRCTSVPCSSPASATSSQTSVTAATSQTESWLDITTISTGPPSLDPPQSEEDEPQQQQQQQQQEQQPSTEEDEMERLYLHLKEARLSPTGLLQPASKRDYRASFIKRCQDEVINEKLHHVRTLNSTLKSKEADLLCLEQVLADPSLSAYKYRQWREANVLLLQEVAKRRQPPGRRHSPPPQEPTQTTAGSSAPYYTETSV